MDVIYLPGVGSSPDSLSSWADKRNLRPRPLGGILKASTGGLEADFRLVIGGFRRRPQTKWDIVFKRTEQQGRGKAYFHIDSAVGVVFALFCFPLICRNVHTKERERTSQIRP